MTELVEDGHERLHIKGFVRGVVTAYVCVKWGSVRLFTQLGSTLSHNPTSRCPPKYVPLQKTPIFSLFTVIINRLWEGGRAGSAETAHFSHCLFVLRLYTVTQSVWDRAVREDIFEVVWFWPDRLCE